MTLNNADILDNCYVMDGTRGDIGTCFKFVNLKGKTLDGWGKLLESKNNIHFFSTIARLKCENAPYMTPIAYLHDLFDYIFLDEAAVAKTEDCLHLLAFLQRHGRFV